MLRRLLVFISTVVLSNYFKNARLTERAGITQFKGENILRL